MKSLSISEQREWAEAEKLLLQQILKILSDTRGFEGVDPSWDYAWNELSDEAQTLVKETRKHIIETIKLLDELLSG